jgi:hypothetical protein
MKKNDIPSTNFTGEIEINKIKIPCAVLFPESSSPKRIFVQREIVGLLTGNKKGGFDRYLKPKNLQNYIPEKFKNYPLSESTIMFKYKGRISQGFEATDLIDLCEMYIRARKDGNLLDSQLHLAASAEIIMMAFAKIGVVAVVDEATGFQEVRNKKALARLLEKFIEKEYHKWSRMFPLEFYKEMFRLNNWQFDPLSIKRPSVIGKYTNDLVYARLAPTVLDTLHAKNPITEKGYRKQKHHQWLTGNIGIPALRDHLSGLIALMRASANWRQFKRLVERAYPKFGDTYLLPFDEE